MLKFLMAFVLAVFLIPLSVNAQFSKEKFQKQIHFATGGVAANSGLGYSSAKPLVDGDVWTIPAGVVIEKVYVVVDTAVAGTTDIDVGDATDADGFVDGSLSLTLGTPGMYGWSIKTAGAYLKLQGVDASDTVANAKLYSVATALKVDVTGTNSAGKVRVIVEGYYL